MSSVFALRRNMILSVVSVCSAMNFTIGPAGAASKIKCNGPWQVVKGVGEIATPYCGDGYLARVARGYGVKVSANTIRWNPERKSEVCRLIGHDNRVSDICAGLTDEDYHGRR